MSIEILKKILESDFEEIKSYHGCLTGDCPHNNSTDCCLELMNQVHEAATNRLLPLLKKAVEMVKFVDLNTSLCPEHRRNQDIPFCSYSECDIKIKAREFLTEIKKESGK